MQFRNAIIFLIPIVSLLACKDPVQKTRVLAKVGERSLTEAELEWGINQLPPIKRAELKDSTALRQFFTQWVLEVATAEKAKKIMGPADPIFGETVEFATKREIARFFHNRHVVENLGVEEPELKKIFEAKKNTYPKGTTFESQRKYIAEELVFPEEKLQKAWATDSAKYQRKSPKGYEELRKVVLQTLKSELFQSLNEKLIADLRAKYKVELKDLFSDKDVRKAYEKNPNMFRTQRKAKVLLLVAGDSTGLRETMNSLTDRTKFVESAKTQENESLKALGGEIGWVKKGHSLPYFGVQGLVSEWLGKNPAKGLSPMIPLDHGKKFGVFWVDSIVEPQLKPLERVEKSISVQLQEGQFGAEIDSTQVLATASGKTLVDGKLFYQLLREVPANRRAKVPKERLIEFLIAWELLYKECEERKLDQYPLFKYRKNKTTDQVWFEAWNGEVRFHRFGHNEEAIKAFYQKYKSDFAEFSYEQMVGEISRALSFSEETYRLYFKLGLDQFGGKYDLDSLDKYRYKVYQFGRTRELVPMQLKNQMEILKTVENLDSNLLDPSVLGISEAFAVVSPLWSKLENPPDSIKFWPKSQRESFLKNIRNTLKQAEAYHRGAPKTDTLTFVLGQIEYDLKNYEDAVKHFEKFALLYEERPERHKALFMKGFLYAEHLKMDSLAVRSFEELLEKYPKSDFADDADFMIRDIRSGRELSRSFLDKLEKGEIPTAPEDTTKESN